MFNVIYLFKFDRVTMLVKLIGEKRCRMYCLPEQNQKKIRCNDFLLLYLKQETESSSSVFLTYPNSGFS